MPSPIGRGPSTERGTAVAADGRKAGVKATGADARETAAGTPVAEAPTVGSFNDAKALRRPPRAVYVSTTTLGVFVSGRRRTPLPSGGTRRTQPRFPPFCQDRHRLIPISPTRWIATGTSIESSSWSKEHGSNNRPLTTPGFILGLVKLVVGKGRLLRR